MQSSPQIPIKFQIYFLAHPPNNDIVMATDNINPTMPPINPKNKNPPEVDSTIKATKNITIIVIPIFLTTFNKKSILTSK
jgi:hypothetical protein